MHTIQIPIARPPWSSLGKRLESTCRKALFDYEMLKDCSHVAVALSGGKDSLTLLYLLHAIRGKGFPSFQLSAIHIDGPFSCGAGVSKEWLKAICKELEIPFLSRTSQQKKETLECYSCSRTRRKLLFEAAKEIGSSTVAFGHHRDDQAQTLLLNLFHKGEFAGNLPKIHMVHYGITIIRPLIYIAENDIRHFAAQHGFNRITCQCPVGQNSKRKEVDRLLDEIAEKFPNIRQNVAYAGLKYGSQKAKRVKESLESNKEGVHE
ncbi:MAG: tRNA 2-thiocytidine biosynthesis TtcA family protein [Chlamydiales bacterium]